MIRTFVIIINAIILFYGLYAYASDKTDEKIQSNTKIKIISKAESYSTSKEQKILYADAVKFARSTQESDLARLESLLTDTEFLLKLDSSEAYNGPAVQLHIAGVMQILSENSAPPARKVLLSLTTSLAFLDHRARVDLLIQTLGQIKPAPREVVDFWERHFQPEDGYSSLTVWAVLDNGSEPAIALFERKMKDNGFPKTEREYWLTAAVLQHRNDLPLLQACARLLDSGLEEPYRLLLIDVLFDYKPDDWYGAGHWYKPRPRKGATPEALKELRALAQKALKTQPLSRPQTEKIKSVVKVIDSLRNE
jgi:hypothetical protein